MEVLGEVMEVKEVLGEESPSFSQICNWSHLCYYYERCCWSWCHLQTGSIVWTLSGSDYAPTPIMGSIQRHIRLLWSPGAAHHPTHSFILCTAKQEGEGLHSAMQLVQIHPPHHKHHPGLHPEQEGHTYRSSCHGLHLQSVLLPP